MLSEGTEERLIDRAIDAFEGASDCARFAKTRTHCMIASCLCVNTGVKKMLESILVNRYKHVV